jgi:hypothetical protein
MRFSHDQRSHEDGVSESIGFLLIFTMIILGIGMVTLYGYPMLTQQQVSADEQIMEKNMIVLQNDMKSLVYKTVPYKETSLKIDGGPLTVYNSVTVPATSTISIYQQYPPSPPYIINSFQSGDLRYESISAETDISLQNGAVVKRDRIQPGSAMLASPRWFYDGTTNTMVINLITVNSTERIGRTGIGTVQMVLDQSMSNFTAMDILPGNGNAVYLNYKSDPKADFSTAWISYFRSLNMQQHTEPDGTIDYQLPIDPNREGTLVIKKYDVVIKSL